MNLLSVLPARYAKWIASLITAVVVYLQVYGTTWHLVTAVTMFAGTLGVAGVPNTTLGKVVTDGQAFVSESGPAQVSGSAPRETRLLD